MNWLVLVLQGLSALPGIIAKVEAAKPTTPGAGKKTAVLDEVATAMTAADPVFGPIVASHPAVQEALSVATDALVDVFNQSASVATQQAAATPPAPPPPPPPPAPTPAATPSAAGPATIASAKSHDGLP
jgi:hypothetical protein